MIVREVLDKEKDAYNKQVSHIIQSWEWGEFRKKTGVDVVRLGQYEGKKLFRAYQLTFHSVPYLKQKIGYLPKGPLPDKQTIDALVDTGKKYNAAFIKLEPLQQASGQAYNKLFGLGLTPSKKSLFTKYNFVLDLTKSEEELLSSMHPKTRYNIRLAEKKGVKVYDSTKDSDFEIHLKLYFETTKRQKYFGHTPKYHKQLWQILKEAKMARVVIAKYKSKPLVSWMLFNFGDTLYYPYGGSSTEYREVMASNLVAWEAIKLGKKLKLKTFDMWGALGPEPDKNDSWYGFHRFKAGYGAKHVEYIGTWDLVLNKPLYSVLNVADKVRWMVLRVKRK
ncbi:MAG TPA: peptidoglycan bridge formation glycyltransferase FemA/FemB family protein [Mariniflexile sp.]